MTTTSRRALLGATAVLAGGAVVNASVIVPAEADPIFLAIERHRQIEAAYIEACHLGDGFTDDLADELGYQASAALAALVAMTPRSIVGCARVLRYVETHARAYEQTLFRDEPAVEETARDFLSRIASTLELRAVQS